MAIRSLACRRLINISANALQVCGKRAPEATNMPYAPRWPVELRRRICATMRGSQNGLLAIQGANVEPPQRGGRCALGELVAFLVDARPVLGSAHQPAQGAAFNPERVGLAYRDVGGASFAIFRIVDYVTVPSPSRRLHVEKDLLADHGSTAQSRVRVPPISVIWIPGMRHVPTDIPPACLDPDLRGSILGQPFTDGAH